MMLSIKGFGWACGILWSSAILLVCVGHAIWPSYGGGFLDIVSSVYPGLKMAGWLGQTLLGTLYGLFDGAIAGASLAWTYNRVS